MKSLLKSWEAEAFETDESQIKEEVARPAISPLRSHRYKERLPERRRLDPGLKSRKQGDDVCALADQAARLHGNTSNASERSACEVALDRVNVCTCNSRGPACFLCAQLVRPKGECDWNPACSSQGLGCIPPKVGCRKRRVLKITLIV